MLICYQSFKIQCLIIFLVSVFKSINIKLLDFRLPYANKNFKLQVCVNVVLQLFIKKLFSLAEVIVKLNNRAWQNSSEAKLDFTLLNENIFFLTFSFVLFRSTSESSTTCLSIHFKPHVRWLFEVGPVILDILFYFNMLWNILTRAAWPLECIPMVYFLVKNKVIP